MGYTRYWERTDKAYGDDFVNEVQKIFADCASRGIILKDGRGEGSGPKADINLIWFNGNGEFELDHETCFIPNTTYEHYEKGFNFCKTARKPYDYAVRRVLKLAEEYGIITDVSEDGPNDEIISDIEYLLNWESTYSLKKKMSSGDFSYNQIFFMEQVCQDVFGASKGTSVEEQIKQAKEKFKEDEAVYKVFIDFLKELGVE